jgi:mRNA-degrading endonuclease toxin of MazEF toxin-antitoxin module
VRRGEVRWGNPRLDVSGRKRRPFVVVSHDAFNANDAYLKVMVVHLTTVRRAGGPYDWEVEIPRGVASLRQSSIVKCGEIYTFLKADIGQLIGTLSREHMDRVDAALKIALDLGV